MRIRNRVANSQLDGGAGVWPSLPTSAAGNDCIAGVGGSGGSFTDANIVENVELKSCPDKAVKSAYKSYIKVRDSYIHHNMEAGIQATFSGNVEASRNLLEKIGYNSVSSTPINTSSNGIAANGNDSATPTFPAILNTDGNVVRTATLRGISVNNHSTAILTNDMVCGTTNGTTGNGLAVIGAGSDVATATVSGGAFVHNFTNGATLDNSWAGNFGTSGSTGRNAFMFNNRIGGGGNYDLFNTTGSTASAVNNQWNGAGCSVSGSCTPSIGGGVTTSGFMPYKDSLVTGANLTFTPNNPKLNQLVFMNGTGFNAVGSYSSTGTTCNPGISYNHCPAASATGVCVEIEVSPTLWARPKVYAVTPTRIAFEMPSVTCTKPLAVRVTQIRSNGTTTDTATGTICTN